MSDPRVLADLAPAIRCDAGCVDLRRERRTGRVDALGGALPGELVVLAQERWQLERLQVMSKQKLGCIGHDAAPVSKPRYVLACVIAT